MKFRETSTSGGLINIGDHCVKSWSTTQTLIALSSGEAEFYSLTRCSALSLGMQSLLQDLGLDLDIRVFTDATTGKAIASRRGLGKVRHIATHELWVQERVMRGDIEIVKIKNWYNTADLMTKYLTGPDITEILEQLGHKSNEPGRSTAAPNLSLLEAVYSLGVLQLYMLGTE